MADWMLQAESLGARPRPMDTPVIERAFQIARSGDHESVRHIVQQLQREGYVDAQDHLLDSPLLRQQLLKALRSH